MPERLRITGSVTLAAPEIRFTFSRSSMPGGQNVNKVNTRATLLFDVSNSPSLSDHQKQRIITQLQTRVSKNGILRVVSYRHRTQGANKKAATERFIELIRLALKNVKPRRKTTVPRSSKEKRIVSKKQRGDFKELRKKIKI